MTMYIPDIFRENTFLCEESCSNFCIVSSVLIGPNDVRCRLVSGVHRRNEWT